MLKEYYKTKMFIGAQTSNPLYQLINIFFDKVEPYITNTEGKEKDLFIQKQVVLIYYLIV